MTHKDTKGKQGLGIRWPREWKGNAAAVTALYPTRYDGHKEGYGLATQVVCGDEPSGVAVDDQWPSNCLQG